MNIDWDLAPEWAVAHALYVSPSNEIKEVWAGADKYQQLGHERSFPYGGTVGKDCFHNARRYQFKYETLRPAPWNGEGLPPVGTVCEMALRDGNTAMVTVLAYDGTHAWLKSMARLDDKYPRFSSEIDGTKQFRPIRTPEQIEAEERRRNIAILTQLLCADGAFDVDDPEVSAAVIKIYDAGYRKAVKP